MNQKLTISSALLAIALITGCQDHRIPSTPTTATATTLATGLVAPISVETDGKGRVFVAEQGTGKNDSRVTEVTPDGKLYPVVTGLYSATNTTGDLDATDHLLYVNGTLYFLNPKGLYKIDVASFTTGSSPIPAASLTPEYIQQFVLDYKFVNDTGESHLYNMTLGPDDALYLPMQPPMPLSAGPVRGIECSNGSAWHCQPQSGWSATRPAFYPGCTDQYYVRR